MSADLSDPSIAPLIAAVESKSDPTSWLLLHYSTPSQPSPLLPLASGPDPVLTQWQEHIRACGEEIIFGYGWIGNPPMRKGLVLLYLSTAVGGVRRARAVVHSRAVAQLFPDYSALITISDPNELTPELVADKLALSPHHISAASSATSLPVAPPVTSLPTQPVPEPPRPVTKDMETTAPPGLPRVSEASHETEGLHSGAGAPAEPVIPVVEANEEPANAVPFPASASPNPNTDDFTPGHGERKTSLSLSARIKKAMPGLTTAFGQPQSPPLAQDRVVSGSTPPATDADPKTPPPKKMSLASILPGRNSDSSDAKRSPKHSLTTNFGRPAQSSPPPAPASGSPGSSTANLDHRALTSNLITSQSPSSPRTGSIGRFFSRKSGSGASPAASHPSSPVVDLTETLPPPLPPKDLPPSAQHRDGYGVGEEDEPGTSASGSKPGSSRGPRAPGDDRYSPSPSAKEALSLASSRRVKEEHDIQEDFRRHEQQRERLRTVSMNRNAVVLDDVDLEEVGLPYDRPSMDDTHLSTSEGHTIGTAENVLQGPYPGGLMVANGMSPPARAEDLAAAEEGHAEQVVETERGLMPATAIAEEEEEKQAQAQKELAELEAEQKARAVLAAEEAGLVAKEEQERERIVKLEAERARIEAEKEELGRAEEDRVERERKEAEEAEAKRLEEEKLEVQRKAAEHARLQEEKRKFEEAERQRIETEERERREEEERKAETARVRKESMRDLFRKGKAENGVMLQGFVTVQTMNNMTWRRRHFQLYGHELRLFKAEHDAQPIMTVPLMRGSQMSEKYEESQVQDSFKLVSRNGQLGSPPETYFMFADSADDKEMLIEGLNIAMSD